MTHDSLRLAPPSPPSIPMAHLQAAVSGRVIAPDDAGYDDARAVFYGGIDRRPAAIVRAADSRDVARVVMLARETGVELAVRGGGHSNAGHGTTEGGIVLDLRDSDEGETRVRAAYPGATWNRLTAVKARNDPANFFRLNQNIPPAIEHR